METQNIDDIYDSNDDDATVLDRGPAIATIEWNSMTFPLYEGDNIVGRSDQKNLDVRLGDDTVSDVHANLEITEDGVCYCKDLASNNGNSLMISSDYFALPFCGDLLSGMYQNLNALVNC